MLRHPSKCNETKWQSNFQMIEGKIFRKNKLRDCIKKKIKINERSGWKRTKSHAGRLRNIMALIWNHQKIENLTGIFHRLYTHAACVLDYWGEYFFTRNSFLQPQEWWLIWISLRVGWQIFVSTTFGSEMVGQFWKLFASWILREESR